MRAYEGLDKMGGKGAFAAGARASLPILREQTLPDCHLGRDAATPHRMEP